RARPHPGRRRGAEPARSADRLHLPSALPVGARALPARVACTDADAGQRRGGLPRSRGKSHRFTVMTQPTGTGVHAMSDSITRRRFALGAAAATGAAMLPVVPGAFAQQWPSKPIRFVVPFPAGGTTDILGRLVAAELNKAWGAQTVVENRGGAGGNIGAEAVARSAPDGHTMLVCTVGTHGINKSLYSRLPFDPVKDFTPVTLLALVPNVIVVHPSVKAGTVKELIALLKANPGRLDYASSGNGTSIHLSAELFKSMTGTFMTHIPYRGSAPAIADLLAGQVQLMFD